MKNRVLILLRKELKERLSVFTTRRKETDFLGKLLSCALVLSILTIICFVLREFSNTYLAVKINKVADPYARLYEMTTVIYAAIIVVNVLSGVRTINKSLLGSDDLRIFITMPVSSSAMYMSKMIIAYLRQLLISFLIVFPINLTLSLQIDLGAQFYGMTILIIVLLPMISLSLGSIIALPIYFLKRLVASRYVVSLILVTVIAGLAFWLYSGVLGFIADLISTGDAKYFFNAENMREIQRYTSSLYPAVFFADMLLAKNVGAATGFVVLITAISCSAGVLVGRLLLVPASQNKLFADSNRSVYTGGVLREKHSKFFSFIKKELIQVVRTPSYAFRYFSTAVIMPLMVYFCMDVFSDLASMLVIVNCNFEIAVILIVMFGNLTNTYCATNVSRDGYFFFVMKTLPVNYRAVIAAKVAFCFMPSLVATSVSVGLIGGLGYVSAGEAVFLLWIALEIAIGQICFATRKDLNHPRFALGQEVEAEESNSTLSALVIIGLIVSFMVGVLAVVSGFVLKIQKGEKFGEMVSMITVAIISNALLAGALAYLFVGLKRKIYKLYEAGV